MNEDALLAFLADEIIGTYKMPRDRVLPLLAESLSVPEYAGLRRAVACAGDLRSVVRLAGYKGFRKAARTGVYRALRQYKNLGGDVDDVLAELVSCADEAAPQLFGLLVAAHISTRERLAYRDDFLKTLYALVTPQSRWIDVGCGFGPLLLPPDFFRPLSCYIAVDRDKQAIQAVNLYAKKNAIPNLKGYVWDIGSGQAELSELTGISHYDVALLLKVIPAVARADRIHSRGGKGLQVLGRFPANLVFATASRESMTKHESIARREMATLRRFAGDYDWGILAGYTWGNESGFRLSKEERS